jgi:hypothetical protein
MLVALVALTLAACGGSSDDAASAEATASDSATTATAEETPTPPDLDTQKAELEGRVIVALDTTYGQDGFTGEEERMVAFLHEVTTTEELNRFVKPDVDEQVWLVGHFPAGLSEAQLKLLEAVYGLTLYGTPGPPFSSRADERVAFLQSSFAGCISDDAYGTLSAYSLETLQFYASCVNAEGIPIAGAPGVDQAALEGAQNVVLSMLACRPDVLERLDEIGRLSIYDGPQSNQSLRGLPEFVTAEEGGFTGSLGGASLLFVAGVDEDLRILEHEFAHLIEKALDDEEVATINLLHTAAREQGLWANTYAISNPREYFAELSQVYLGRNFDEPTPPGPFAENGVNGVEELRAYDPAAYEFLATIYCRPT